MALVFIDGFDHYATADITKKWSALSGATISGSSGRRGGGALSVGSILQYAYKSVTAAATYTVGFAVNLSNFTYTTNLICINEGGTQHITLGLTTSGTLRVYRGAASGGTTLATGTTTLSTSQWYYIELKVTVDDVNGVVELRLNGSGSPEINLTSTDTRNGGATGLIDRISMGTAAGGANYSQQGFIDDFYVTNTSGAVNTGFLGDVRVDTLLPTGDGNYTDFTPSTGSTHYNLVDETTPNTTDYVSSSTVDDRDSYTFPDLQMLTSQTIHGVQVNAAALKSDSGSRELGLMTRLSSTDDDSASIALLTSQSYISAIFEVDPAAAAWTESNVNSAEFGVKVTA